MTLFLHVGILVVTFVAVLGFYFAVMMDRLRITYVRLYGITCLYFLIVTGVVFYANRSYFLGLTARLDNTPIFILIIMILTALTLIQWTNTNIKRPLEFIEKNPHQSFLLLDYRYFLSKGFEIMFQQTIVILLTVLLARVGFSLAMIMFLFAIVFGIAHTPLIFYDKAAWGWYYTIFSFIAGFIFPPLILNVNFGFIYAFLIHWLFYAIGGILFWVYQSRKV